MSSFFTNFNNNTETHSVSSKDQAMFYKKYISPLNKYLPVFFKQIFSPVVHESKETVISKDTQTVSHRVPTIESV